MRAFWTTILILAAAGIAVLLATRGTETPTPVVADAPRAVPSNGAQATPPQSMEMPSGAATVVAPPVESPPTGASLALGLNETIPGASVRPGTLVMKGGEIFADGKFSIRGHGTKESPYDISWDLLMSASDTFIPRLGEKQIPQRIALLNNAHVRVSGFIAFPLVATEASECLVMLNQWDGCCIGVPPSPYDAVEVKLILPADNSRRHLVRVGTIDGVFHIDPYVVERWLVGLYTMDSATLSTEM